MIAETGFFALLLALALSILLAASPLAWSASGDRSMMALARPLMLAMAGFVAMAFAMLMAAYVTSDFSLATVAENSHSTMPLIFKITGVWGNHEGSMLLWALILAIFGALVALVGNGMPARLQARVLSVQGLIAAAFLAFIAFTSNPFLRLDPAPPEGQDLNPVLQDIGLAIHPPLLYLGYVGFSVAFAFAIAALIEGRIDAAWARYVRPWTLTAWSFLTVGIAMGSYWAYYVLGWGGFWFWDPVENASLMPWLAGTALVHSTIVMEKRDALKVWTLLLAILAFSLSLLGTFLVRSGVLTSVHAFASDPRRGAFILAILAVFIGGGLTLFAARAGELKPGGLFAPVSREGALVLNNLLLASAAAAVLIGTLYPLALEALTGDKISVGPPYFNATVLPLLAPLLLALPFGQSLAWKRGDLYGTAQRLMMAFGLAALLAFAIWAVDRGGPVLAPLGVGLGFFVILGSAGEIVTRSWPAGASWPAGTALPAGAFWRIALRRAAGLPRQTYGSVIAHMGMGLTVIGIAATAWHSETITMMRLGEAKEVGAYTVTLAKLSPLQGPNYRETAAIFSVASAGVPLGDVVSTKRIYTVRGTPTTQVGLMTRGLSQIYASLGDGEPDGRIGVRLYWKPFVLLIWLGAMVMAAGGALSLSDRRLRVGFAIASRLRPVGTEAPAAPAE
ncbi:cytochrome c-type biogenesis protein CcmF [Rhizobiales bacterium GAS191]|nr:cytochrome c-type biogenesis protein CcmF [Rhizobiales bacterium GAS191]